VALGGDDCGGLFDRHGAGVFGAVCCAAGAWPCDMAFVSPHVEPGDKRGLGQNV
jgi:hypothetical protein